MALLPEPLFFDLTVGRHDSLAIVAVTGELDLATAPQLATAVAEQHDAELVVVDLTAATFIDSTGVRTLLEAEHRRTGSGSRLFVLAGEGPVRRVLDLCQLDGQLTIISERPAAPDPGLAPAR